MARRQFTLFSLSFLDIMSCGFGAVILFFMIINAQMQARSNELTRTLRAEAERLETEMLSGSKQLVALRNSLQETQHEQRTTEGLSRSVVESLTRRESEVAELDRDTLARARRINELKTDLKSLEQGTLRLKAGSEARETQGERLRAFAGEGDRQYLTGLRLGGSHILILVDASASMLADNIVNILRRRHLPDAEKVRSAKWRQAVGTVDWLTTQLPRDSRFQIQSFNVMTSPVVEGDAKGWLDAGDPKLLEAAVSGLRKVIPGGGTSLYQAFAAAKAMRPAPDNIILLTDGLPTQGRDRPAGSRVSGKERLRHFERAVKELPGGVPVNVILFPMEGDPYATSAFWQLARDSGGSFMSPSPDWP